MRCPSCGVDPCDCFDEDSGHPWTEEERRPLPTFGCACENALIVDTTCDACIEYLRQRDAETEATPGAIPATEIADDRTVCATCGARIPCGCPQRCIVCRRTIDHCICHLQGAKDHG